MMHFHKVFAYFLVTVCAAAALAQTETPQPETPSSPVAFVYLTGQTRLYGLAASSTGELTKIPGSPFAAAAVSAVVTRKYLYVVNYEDDFIHGYAIAGNGSLTLSSVTDPFKYYRYNCGDTGTLQSDLSGATIYDQYDVSECNDPNYIQAFKVEEKGDLQYEGRTETHVPAEDGTLPLSFATGNKFVYQTSCEGELGGGVGSETGVFKRESDGYLNPAGYDNVAPNTGKAGFVYCSELIAADGAGHLVDGFLEYDEHVAGKTGPFVLASYTVSPEGKLSTESTAANMPTTGVDFPQLMSIAPSGKFLAVAGTGFQVYHFNGGKPITQFTGVLQPKFLVFDMAWDGANHLYVLGDKLHVYTVTETSIDEAPGSPYSFYDAQKLSVLGLK